MIRFEHVSKSFGPKKVLDDVSYEIAKGEVFMIVGPSGTGKSVSLKHMVRLLTPDTGRVLVAGEDISHADGRELERMREHYGYLSQGGALLAWMNVADNVALPLREKTKMGEDEIHDKVMRTLALVGLANDAGKIRFQPVGNFTPLLCQRKILVVFTHVADEQTVLEQNAEGVVHFKKVCQRGALQHLIQSRF